MTSTATHLPVGTRVRVVNFAPDYDGLTAVVTGQLIGEWADWTAVAMDRRVSGNAGLMFRPQFLEALPEPTVSLVKATLAVYIPAEFTRAEADAELAAGMVRASAAVMAPEAEHADLVTAQERVRHLEELHLLQVQALADQAQLIAEQKEALRIVREHRAELAGTVTELKAQVSQLQARDQLDRSAQLDQAEDRIVELERDVELASHRAEGSATRRPSWASRVAELEKALNRRNARLADATETAEEYRAELKRALEGIVALAHSTLDDD